MLGLDAGLIGFVLLSTVAAAGLAYGILQPRIALERKAESRLSHYKRLETDSRTRKAARDQFQEAARRRKTVQTSLKELEKRQKERDTHTAKVPLKRRLQQAGLTLSVRRFYVLSVAFGLLCGFLGLIFSGSLLVALGLMIVGAAGLPRWLVSHLRKRREKKFIEEFPNAIDLIVRGVKSGLPLNDCLAMIAAEAAEPVRSEFQKVIEAQRMGLTTADSVDRLYRNVPLSETNFFAIVIAIQMQAGGNLAEALGNLSKVLRERKKMKAKVQAMSMEAKASAAIIGALPIGVGLLVYLTTPDYIMLLFTETVGNIIIAVSAAWMMIGIFVMKQMINFDF